MGTISGHQLSTFASPVNGTTPIDANTVRGNDNTIKTAYNAHDADTTIHLQNGLVASRPAASTAGQTWLATDTSAVYAYLDTGSAWVEWNYLRNTGGTVTGNVLITGTLGVTGVLTGTTVALTADANALRVSSATGTAANYLRLDNTGAIFLVGVERSTGNGILTGAQAYDAVINQSANTGIAFGVNNTLAMRIASTGAVTLASTLATAAPTGGAGAWKVGIANAVSPTSPNRTVTIDIGGTTYYLAAKTTND